MRAFPLSLKSRDGIVVIGEWHGGIHLVSVIQGPYIVMVLVWLDCVSVNGKRGIIVRYLALWITGFDLL